MNRVTTAAAVALALLTFLQFPGHTYLQQDSQIYVPILEHLRDPAVLRNDMLAQQPHVAFTLYDEAARALRAATGLGFREVLAIEQVSTRALGIWGLYLIATALGLSAVFGLLVAAIVSLGAAIAGPSVLTFEYEPTPRAFAVPLLFCAIGLAAHRRDMAASVACAAAFLFHPPTAVPVEVLLAAVLVARRSWWAFLPLGAAAVVLLLAAHSQAEPGQTRAFLRALTAEEEQLQRMRAPYVWVSTWPARQIWHHVVLFAVAVAAFLRVRQLGLFLLGLPIVGLLSMPVSWVLLERFHWALVPQFQPMRTLLFVALSMQILTAVAGVYAAKRRRFAEAALWFGFAYLLPLVPVVTEPIAWRRTLLALSLGLFTAAAVQFAPRFAPAAALAAFFAIPILGGVVNYPDLLTPDVAQLSAWARSSTPPDAVFVFPDARNARSTLASSAPKPCAPSTSIGKAAARSTTCRISPSTGGPAGSKP